ncbi:hypothetical protein CAI21_04810 [Alkalilimnicola ehrlichii]|uniref:Uncharacterized protein n=1 Tax=Alkalilimnicola ehrlichii TaxID=351052 RepID=A0A3E0X285_9GAMM|nr:hypothetical protein [Alkalilimnicola ehrlichii]RFA30823.1 hypothetical protein CAI21_04810 [Alkalilimnicola ehrlichii]RFA38401.1 hypothetical protein CAL65_06175 [Alkalilimnicola ehrlichii]
MSDAKTDAALYVLTGLLQRLEAERPGLIQDMLAGIEGDRKSLPPNLENKAHVEAIFDEALTMLRRANRE